MKLEEKVKAVVGKVEKADGALAAEMEEKRANLRSPGARGFVPESMMGDLEGPTPDMAFETIVLSVGRPVLSILRDEAVLMFSEPESQVWKQRLEAAHSKLVSAIPAVGRIELKNHPFFEWVGTGWLVDDGVVVTNRHVAREFGHRSGSQFVFRQGVPSGRMAASIDFIEEFGRPESLEFHLDSILHIEEEPGPDVAFLRVSSAGGSALAKKVSLSEKVPERDEMVAVIGYPARDSRIPDQALMLKIFGDVYDKKRLAPGQITDSTTASVLHDCSTLGGNSGSVVLSLSSGKALGLHYAGRFAEANFAVPAHIIGQRLDDVLRGEKRRPATARPVAVGEGGRGVVAGGRSLTCTVPIRITVDIGDIGDATAARFRPATVPVTDVGAGDGIEERVKTSGDPQDYVDRTGYEPSFLGDGFDVPLPVVTKNKSDILKFEIDGVKQHELKYQHFSVVMSRGRRICLFSAVNIDGGASRKKKRVEWRTDPRIPQSAQISEECYGNPPRFSRGHMTRREDPVWGSDAAATLGNADSMHVTNAVPQMQLFNAPIWLKLEDYALDHARGDDMRICVFTGPFLTKQDPVRFGVEIPTTFWKVIAFIHDETGDLCATGYTMSQEDFVQEEEFVFGQHGTSQVSIAFIERKSGLSFGPLSAVDPFEQVEEALPHPLIDLTQIRFLG